MTIRQMKVSLVCILNMFSDDCVIICLYVYDMHISRTNMEIIIDTRSFLSAQFEMKDMGETNVVLGVNIKRTQDGIGPNQSIIFRKYLESLIHLMLILLGHLMMLVCIL